MSDLTIWKFELIPDQSVSMPAGSVVLGVGAQEKNIYLWALVNPENTKINRRFMIFGTGQKLPDTDMKFIGTVHMPKLGLVFHVFE